MKRLSLLVKLLVGSRPRDWWLFTFRIVTVAVCAHLMFLMLAVPKATNWAQQVTLAQMPLPAEQTRPNVYQHASRTRFGDQEIQLFRVFSYQDVTETRELSINALGVDVMPGEGEMVVSPALDRLLREHRQTSKDPRLLLERFSGLEQIGILGEQGFRSHSDLVVWAGISEDEAHQLSAGRRIGEGSGFVTELPEVHGRRLGLRSGHPFLDSLLGASSVALAVVLCLVVNAAVTREPGRVEEQNKTLRLLGYSSLYCSSLGAIYAALVITSGVAVGLVSLLVHVKVPLVFIGVAISAIHLRPELAEVAAVGTVLAVSAIVAVLMKSLVATSRQMLPKQWADSTKVTGSIIGALLLALALSVALFVPAWDSTPATFGLFILIVTSATWLVSTSVGNTIAFIISKLPIETTKKTITTSLFTFHRNSALYSSWIGLIVCVIFFVPLLSITTAASAAQRDSVELTAADGSALVWAYTGQLEQDPEALKTAGAHSMTGQFYWTQTPLGHVTVVTVDCAELADFIVGALSEEQCKSSYISNFDLLGWEGLARIETVDEYGVLVGTVPVEIPIPETRRSFHQSDQILQIFGPGNTVMISDSVRPHLPAESMRLHLSIFSYHEAETLEKVRTYLTTINGSFKQIDNLGSFRDPHKLEVIDFVNFVTMVAFVAASSSVVAGSLRFVRGSWQDHETVVNLLGLGDLYIKATRMVVFVSTFASTAAAVAGIWVMHLALNRLDPHIERQSLLAHSSIKIALLSLLAILITQQIMFSYFSLSATRTQRNETVLKGQL